MLDWLVFELFKKILTIFVNVSLQVVCFCKSTSAATSRTVGTMVLFRKRGKNKILYATSDCKKFTYIYFARENGDGETLTALLEFLVELGRLRG